MRFSTCKDRDFALHQRQHFFQARSDVRELQHRLLVLNLDGEMRGHRVGELRVIVDLRDDAHDLGRHFLVELHIALELVDDRARHGFDLDRVGRFDFEDLCLGLVEFGAIRVRADFRALDALDQHLHGPVRQLEQLQHGGKRADLVNGVGRRIVVAGVHLRDQENIGVVPHHLFERANGLLAADEQRHDHVREDHNVAQRQNREMPGSVRGSAGDAVFERP
jgi:hypothetical protein